MSKPNWEDWIQNKKECKRWLSTYLDKGILKPTKKKSILYLRHADHNINLAHWISNQQESIPKTYEAETYDDWIITICYYAIYHCALALLVKQGYSSKNHSATLCFLIYHHFHLQKALDKEEVHLLAVSLDKQDIETVGESKAMRERASYNAGEVFNNILRENIMSQANLFREKIKKIVES